MSMVLPVVRSKMGFRLVLGALCVGAVVGLSLAVALPATQAAEQVPFSPKFEADFWPDERLEQASILITVFYFQDLFS